MGCGNSTSATKPTANKPGATAAVLSAAGIQIEQQDMETSVGMETELDPDYSADYA